MITDKRKTELLEAIKYSPKGKPHFLLVILRSNPLLYSLYSKIRVAISRNIYSLKLKYRFYKNKKYFLLNKIEKQYVKELQTNGIVILENYFDINKIEKIKKQADTLLRELKIDKNGGYNVSHKRIETLEGMSYEEISISESRIAIIESLVNIPDFTDIAFDESLLKIVSNYLKFIPSHASSANRSFPHNPPIESSFFHKDSNKHDVLHIFIYMDDVDLDGGPFCYIPKSHKYNIKSCKPRINYDLGKKEAYGRTPDSEMEKYYKKEEWLPAIAKKGSVIIAHVNGFHKGPMWNDKPIEEQNTRDILHMNFRGNEKMFQKHTKDKILKSKIKHFTPAQKLFLNEYDIV